MPRCTAALAVAMLACLAAPPGAAQSAADSAAIRATALDYVEGWYAGDAERMGRALHPQLAKRVVRTGPGGGSVLNVMGAPELVDATRRGGGRETLPAEQRREVRILDIFQDVASVRADMAGWIDYMQLAKWNGEWKIVNVLWEIRRADGPR